MRGTLPARSRLSAARAFLAGAALLAGAATSISSARAEAGDTAMAVPRLVPHDGGELGLPRPLPAMEATALRQAFRDGTLALDGVRDSALLGHVLADRLLAASARAGVEELRSWLARYPDLPDAPALHALLLTRMPRNEPPPPPPTLADVSALTATDDAEPQGRFVSRNPALDRTVHDAARTGQADRALRLIARTRGLDPVYGALLRAEVAQALFSQGDDVKALAVAEAATRLSHGTVGYAPWIAGLAAWRLDRPELARAWFEMAWRAPLLGAGHRAGAAYWAARAMQVTRGSNGPWLQRAARENRTFYGLLARRTLGQRLLVTLPAATLAEADIEGVAATARGARAYALLQVGQPARAGAELRLLWAETQDRPGFARSVLLVAGAAGLTDLAAQIDGVLQPATARVPAARLRPKGGFRLDPALVYALARLESNFDASAVSPAGARGLMQLMPGTAQYMSGGTPVALHDPATNLEIGQRYLLRLAAADSVGSDLIRLLASYNAGPGTLARWLDAMGPQDDPLLFLEALPGDETRAYVPRVLAYTWLYAAQLRLPSPSLDELAAGLWPRIETSQVLKEATIRFH